MLKPAKNIKFKRINPGEYCSTDGSIKIIKYISRQTYRADEIVWEVSLKGIIKNSFETLREAKEYAENKLIEES